MASPGHFWGAELRAQRDTRGLSLNDLGKLVHRDASYLAKIEKGDRNIPADLARDCDRALNAGGMLVRLHAVVAEADSQQVIPARRDARHAAKQGTRVANGAPLGVSSEGLEAPSGDGEISVPARTADGRIIFVRVSRRLFLGAVGASAVGSAPRPAAQTIASVPRVSSDDVNPLKHFVEMKKVLVDSDNLFGPARVINSVHQQIEIMQHLRQSWRGADRRRLLQVQTRYADLLGWLYQDSGDFPASRRWVDRSLEWSHLAQDRQTTAFILARQSHLAADMGKPADAIDAAEAARATARPNTRTAALAATFAGQGYALWGDADSSSRSYDQARELLLSCEADHESGYGLCFNGFNEGYLDVHRARSLAALGRFLPATEVFQTAIEGLPEGYWRDRGVYLAWQARAYAGGREAEQAADLGLQALVVACETGSARIIAELARLDDSFAQWRVVPQVREFRAALNDVISHQA